MNKKYIDIANSFKALGDPNRLLIIEMLSCGELCACKILEDLHITQPTLSHHMKILCEQGLVNVRKEGKWTHYSLNEVNINSLKLHLDELTKDSEICICKKGINEECPLLQKSIHELD